MFKWINRPEALDLACKLYVDKGMKLRHCIILSLSYGTCKNPEHIKEIEWERFENDLLREIRYRKHGVKITG
jgi:hypothetical protein